MNKKVLFVFISLGIFCTTIFSICSAENKFSSLSQDSASQIAKFLKQKKTREAYLLAQKKKADNIGQPMFDLQLGKAALAIRKFEEAALAFERVLMINAANEEARAGITIAYYKLGIFDVGAGIAKLKKNPFYYRLTVGYDDNVRRATNIDFMTLLGAIDLYSQIVQIPQIYPKPLSFKGTSEEWIQTAEGQSWLDNQDEDFLWQLYLTELEELNAQYEQEQLDFWTDMTDKKGSFYFAPLIGMHESKDIGKRCHLFIDLNAEHKQYLQIRGYDIGQANVLLGSRFYLSKYYILDGTLFYQKYLLNQRGYRDAPIFQIGLSRITNLRNVLKLYVQTGIFSHPNRHERHDTNLYLGGVEWGHISSNQTNLLLSQIFYGLHQIRHSISAFNGNHVTGINITDLQKLTPKTAITFGVTYRNYLYNAPEFPDSARRNDDFWQFTGSFRVAFRPNWGWNIGAAYSLDNSNIVLYKFKRFEIATGISYGF